ncbi:uncharacterized protein LOC118735203 [Rhagoletis pomonella]|uniref:uncharacterized protein LOC118735203 n=1 Tax=Rhagoletis pomonella TaxID=28610 RepID=UPI00178424CC|nr:uncharacterized protein LOC118735203 [Rhagoletis pomonella]
MDFLPSLLAECCPDSDIAKLLKCGRTKSTQIAELIGNHASEKTIANLRARRFSVIVDETTDVSVKKCLVLVARAWESRCDINFYCYKNFFNSKNVPLKNLIGLATDGASVMAGNIGGLKALLKTETDVFHITCTCHSLHLCCSYACKKLPSSIEVLCRNIYSFFSHSPKRIYEFREFQDYCSVKPHKILGICQTRWLSLEAVICRLIEQWESLRLYFISNFLEVNGIRSAELANAMNSKLKAYLLFLSYILPIINNLDKEFQSDSCRLPYLYSNIKSNFLLILSNLLDQKKFNDVCINYRDKSNHINVLKIFIGTSSEEFVQSNLSVTEIIEIKTNILEFYIELLDQIKARFDFGREDLQLLKIITPGNVLLEENVEILPLILKFKNLVDCDPDKVITQWKLLRSSDNNFKKDMDITSFWSTVSNIKNGLNACCFIDLTNFVFNLMTLPYSSAGAERKFSEFALVKTKLRNKLNIRTIYSIMHCKELVQKADAHYVWSAKRDLKDV